MPISLRNGPLLIPAFAAFIFGAGSLIGGCSSKTEGAAAEAMGGAAAASGGASSTMGTGGSGTTPAPSGGGPANMPAQGTGGGAKEEPLKPAGEGVIDCRPMVAAATVPTAGRILHVAMTGLDTNDGAEATPFKSVAHAAEVAMPGDTVLVHEGIYRGRVAPARGGVAGMPITYLAEPGKKVVLKGSDVWTPTWEPAGTNIFKAVPDVALFTDSSQIDGPNPLLVGEAGGYPPGFTLGQVFVDGERMVQMQSTADIQQRPGTWHYEPTEKAIYVHFPDGKAPTGSLVELTTQRRVFAPHLRGLGYITLSGFTIEHAANQYPGGFYNPASTGEQQAGMVGTRSGNHWIIENNIIRFAQGLGIDCGGESEVSGKVDLEGKDQTRIRNTDGHIIRGNFIADNGTGGMMSMGGTGITITNNVFSRNNWVDPPGGAEMAGIKVHYTVDLKITGNMFLDNNATGAYLDAGNRGAHISTNTFIGNRQGVFVELGPGSPTWVDNNVFVDNLVNSIYIHDGATSQLVHNLIANTTGSDQYGASAEGWFLRKVTDRVKNTPNNIAMNNLFMNNDGGSLSLPYPGAGSVGNLTDYNVYKEKTPAILNVNIFTPVAAYDVDSLAAAVYADLGAAKPASVSSFRFLVSAVGLTLDEWRAFWQTHAEPHDMHSLASPGMTATLDRKTWKVAVNLDFDPATVGAQVVPGVTTDFTGAAIPQDGKAKPGPFQSVKMGANEFTVAQCLP